MKPIIITKTRGEWDLIYDKIGKKKLTNFIRSEVRKLGNAYEKNPLVVCPADGEKIDKRPYIPQDSYDKLKIISQKMKIPVSSVVDKLIIQPLLHPDKPSAL